MRSGLEAGVGVQDLRLRGTQVCADVCRGGLAVARLEERAGLLGRADTVPWDPARPPPALLTPGAQVRFVAQPDPPDPEAGADAGLQQGDTPPTESQQGDIPPTPRPPARRSPCGRSSARAPDWVADPGSLAARTCTVSSRSDRVGMRLEGEPLRRTDRRELPSEGRVRGAIQVPPGGAPVVFLADHPVTGGYPVVAVVVDDADVDRAAQVRPGQAVRDPARRPSGYPTMSPIRALRNSSRPNRCSVSSSPRSVRL